MTSARPRSPRWAAAAACAVVATLFATLAGGAPTGAGGPIDRSAAPGKGALAELIAQALPGEHVTVELVLDRGGDRGPAAAAVAAAGGELLGELPDQLLLARLPAQAAAALVRVPGVASVRPPLAQNIQPQWAPLAPMATGEQVAATNAAAWHAAGYSGAGVKVGIIDGFDGATWDAAQAAGEVPVPAGTFCRFQGVDCDIRAAGVTHGVAVAEVLHDMAPNAALYLVDATTTEDLVEAVDWLVDQGVTVVNRSLGSRLDGPGDGTGPLDTVAEYAVQHGIAWFNSAGNEAGRDGRPGRYYRAPFTDGDGDGWHEFVDPAGGGGPVFENLQINCSSGALLSSLRWDDWADVANASDFDLFAFATADTDGNGNGGQYDIGYDADDAIDDAWDFGAEYQGSAVDGQAPPAEYLGSNCQPTLNYFLAIRLDADNDGSDDVLEIMAENPLEHWSNPYSAGYPIVDSRSPGVFGIGAVEGDHTIASYSSEGPTNDGRVKPDFTARSGVASTVFNGPFDGTSASSPVAAGVAALVVSSGVANTPADLRNWLTANATVDAGPAGPDSVFGAGELRLPAPPSAAGPPPAVDQAARYVPVAPTRIFDSRPSEPGPGPKGTLADGGAVDIAVAGAGPVPADAVAAVLNVTVTNTRAPGFVSAYPAGQPRPNASAVNISAAGQTRATLVTVPIGAGGRVTLFTHASADLVADIAGYYLPAGGVPVAAGRFVPVTPQRLFDTRPSEPGPGPKGALAPGQAIDVAVLGLAGVPASGVSAVVVNLTATGAAAPGYVAAYPAGTATPTASNVNLSAAGSTAPNLAVVPLGTGGRISIYSSGGADVLADVTGYITDGSAPTALTGLFVTLPPTRLFDTRAGEPAPGPKGYLGAGAAVDARFGGTSVIPATASAVALTVTGAESPLGFLTAWNTGAPRPTSSTLNFGDTPIDFRANAAMLRIGAGGFVSFFSLNGSHVIADTTGYFLG